LKTIERDAQTLTIGAAASLEDAYAAVAAEYPELAELWTRFASLPIRNAGTLGGNVANGSPIGDSMPALIALGAPGVLQRELPDPRTAARRVLRRLSEDGARSRRIRRGDSRAASRARSALSHLQGLEALRPGHFGRVRRVRAAPRGRRRRGRAHRVRR